MRSSIVVSLAAIAAMSLLIACGGDGSSEVSLDDLVGDWNGITRADAPCSMTVDESGNVIDFGVMTPYVMTFSGTMIESGPQTFAMTLAESSAPATFYTGTFISADAKHGFALIYMGAATMAGCVMQKGAAVIPTYTDADLLGDWSGPHCLYDTGTALWYKESRAGMAATAVGVTIDDGSGTNWIGVMVHNPGGMTGDGVYFGAVSSTAGTYIAGAIMTPDKKAIGVELLPSDGFPLIDIEDVEISMLTKQD